METLLARIPAHSQRQAMDWSLVLASQGIEAVIEQSPETGAWGLLVEPEQFVAALDSIRQYRLENRRWAWRTHLTSTGLVFHWGVLLWCWVLILFHWLGEAFGGRLEFLGTMNDRVPATGQWWRLFTAITLHADVGHLASNVATGLVVMGLAMARFGPGQALLAALLAGAMGNAAGLALRTEHYVGLGASGMVMGGLGLLTAQSLVLLRAPRPAWRPMVAGAAGGVMLFVLVGLNPAGDVLAHAFGFGSGLLLGGGLVWLPERWTRNRWLDRAAGAVATLITVGAWTMAVAAAH
jgi:membrane associated rhomboid family serine protease